MVVISICILLYRNGVVKFESVMKLREELDQLGKMKGITQDEKGNFESYSYYLGCNLYSHLDPEEFLNLMFKHTLQVPPFISIR